MNPTPEQIRNAMLVFHRDESRRVWVVEQGIGGPEIARYRRAGDCQAHVMAGNTAEAILARIARGPCAANNPS